MGKTQKRNILAGIILIISGALPLTLNIISWLPLGIYQICFFIGMVVTAISIFLKNNIVMGMGCVVLILPVLYYILCGINILENILILAYLALLLITLFMKGFPKTKLWAIYFFLPILFFLIKFIAVYIIDYHLFEIGKNSLILPFKILIDFMLYVSLVIMGASLLNKPHQKVVGRAGFIATIFSIVLTMGITIISIAAYGDVYFFGGYTITKILWIIDFISMFIGLFMLPFYITSFNKIEGEETNMQIQLGTKYSFKNGQITILEDRVLIDHKGARGVWTQGFSGEKTIPIGAIQTVQLREGTTFVRGYLQFGIIGEGSSHGGTGGAVRDENSVLLACGTDRGYEIENANAKAIKEYIENKIFERLNAAPQGSTIVQQRSSADELKKFKELLDSSIITQEEFDAKKKQLLGL